MKVSAYCYVFSTSFAIWSHSADPNLTTGQKWGLSAMKLGIAAIGIAIGGITAPWAIAAVVGYAVVSTAIDNWVTDYCDTHGKE